MTDGPDYFGAGQAPQVYPNSAGEPPVGRRTVDERKLWTGGIMAAVVAALVAAVGLLLVRGIADVPVFVQRDGELVDASMWWYAAAAASGAVVATILLNVLLLWAPRPYMFFGWILGLAVVIATLVPYTFDAALGSKVATSAINLAVGVCISSILVGVGRSAARIPDSRRGY
ncbi:MAG TPA: DUF6069 family protein [Mycobacteriales bacterium]|nr:DUF6069 family protein [Mycobacteriales bacterium]